MTASRATPLASNTPNAIGEKNRTLLLILITLLYALNLFDLADNDSYRQYSRRSAGAVGKHGGRVVALGRLDGVQEGEPDVEPCTVMILVEWPSHEAFRAFLDYPEHADLHPLREEGTRNYLWRLYDRMEDLRPFFEAGTPRE